MFAIFSRRLARPKNPLPDFTSVAGLFARWLALPGRRSASQSLRLLESVPLTAHASLALVRFGAENLVLGVTSQNIAVLAKGACAEGLQQKQDLDWSGNPIP
jgi:hypothetical protein